MLTVSLVPGISDEDVRLFVAPWQEFKLIFPAVILCLIPGCSNGQQDTR